MTYIFLYILAVTCNVLYKNKLGNTKAKACARLKGRKLLFVGTALAYRSVSWYVLYHDHRITIRIVSWPTRIVTPLVLFNNSCHNNFVCSVCTPYFWGKSAFIQSCITLEPLQLLKKYFGELWPRSWLFGGTHVLYCQHHFAPFLHHTLPPDRDPADIKCIFFTEIPHQLRTPPYSLDQA